MTFPRPHEPNLRRHPNLVPADRGDVLIATNVSPDGNAVALWATATSAESLRGRTLSGSSFAKIQTDRTVQVRATMQSPTGEVLVRTEIDGFTFAHPRIAAMPDGEWLLAGARCRWTPECVDPNAAVYSSTGEALRYGILGDAIVELRATLAGNIWVSYSDEGIFGNHGWGGPGPEPVGARGIVRFNQQLERSWSYPEDADYGIDDGPGITVDGDDVWLTFFPHYPIVHITDGTVRTWANDNGPAPTILVDAQRRVVLVGQGVTIGELLDDSFRPMATAPLLISRGTRAGPTRIFALGSTLHAYGADGAWWTTDIETLVSTVSS